MQIIEKVKVGTGFCYTVGMVLILARPDTRYPFGYQAVYWKSNWKPDIRPVNQSVKFDIRQISSIKKAGYQDHSFFIVQVQVYVRQNFLSSRICDALPDFRSITTILYWFRCICRNLRRISGLCVRPNTRYPVHH